MSRARFTDKLWAEGHWTVQLKDHGDFEGEAANQPGTPELFFNYPEILDATRHFPYGRLNESSGTRFVSGRHTARAWGASASSTSLPSGGSTPA